MVFACFAADSLLAAALPVDTAGVVKMPEGDPRPLPPPASELTLIQEHSLVTCQGREMFDRRGQPHH